MKKKNTLKIAVLLTCHNRKAKTLKCLRSLFNVQIRENYLIEVFLVDDGSTDGTGEAVKDEFPNVNLIHGNGNLYWNKGMRLAWDSASLKSDYNYYLWLNDDVELSNFAITELIECHNEGIEKFGKHGIVTGACKMDVESNAFSYGGKTDKGPVIPNGKLQNCTYINGNVVLVPNNIYNKLGNLSPDYTHCMGDFDYGLRAQNMGFSCYTTKKYIATCPTNPDPQPWGNHELPFLKRWEYLHSPKGLNLKEYLKFTRKFWGWRWTMFALKAYLKVLTPKYYNKLSGK